MIKLFRLEETAYPGNDQVVDPETGYSITTNGDFDWMSNLLRKMGFEVYWLCERTGKQIGLIIDKMLYVCSSKKALDSKYHEIYMNDIAMYKEYDEFAENKNALFGIVFKDDNGFEYCWKKL
jgi:hypothetical protein